MIMKRSETLVPDFFLYFIKRLEKYDEIWYNVSKVYCAKIT